MNPLNYLKKLANSQKTLIRNISYITALQAFSLLLPIVTYPYLIRVLGKETYGLVVFAQAIIGYLVIIVSYGFNIAATKEISIHRNEPEKLNEIVSCVLIIKGSLFIISFIILSATIWIIPQAHNHKILFYLTLWMCLYELLFPNWYFQGIEQMKFITYINLISRLTFVGLMFIFIHSPKDYLFLPITNGLGAIIAGATSLYIVFKRHKVLFILQPLSNLRYYLKIARPIFISYLSSTIYVGSNRVIIGSVLGMSDVAYYDLGEKITQVLKIPQSILSQTLFPKISLEKNTHFIKKIFKISLSFHLFIFFLTLVFSKVIVLFIGGVQMEPAYLVLNILSITVPVVAMSNIFGTQVLIPFGYSKSFRNVIISSALVYIMLFLVVWQFFVLTVITISILTVVVEFYILFMFIAKCRKYSLWHN